MRRSTAEHKTIVLGHVFNVPVDAVFAAFADDAQRRALGSACSKQVFSLEVADFRIGGCDAFRFGIGSVKYRGQTIYHDIVPRRRIVATEVVQFEDRRLSVTCLTLEFIANGSQTNFKMTAQIVALDGADLIQESTIRPETLLERLKKHLARQFLA